MAAVRDCVEAVLLGPSGAGAGHDAFRGVMVG
jgi:hypothetical protein